MNLLTNKPINKKNNIINTINIPSDFNSDLYLSIINNNNNTLNTKNKIYCHFLYNGLKNINIYKSYYKKYYNIPNNFVEETYVKYINKYENIKFSEYKELYLYYTNIGYHKYPLNDEYSRFHFCIPCDFDRKSYLQRYNTNNEINALNDNELYHFYNLNNTSYSLDSEYYRIFYNIPCDFDRKPYLQRYNSNNNEINTFNDNELYHFYNLNNTSFSLDSEYYRIFYNINHEEEFNWIIYLECYEDDFDIKNRNIRDVFNHYHLKKYQTISKLNVKYYTKIYNIPNDFDYIQYFNLNSFFIFDDNIQYIFKVYNKIITIDDIYKNILTNENKTDLQNKFIYNYNFLINNFPQITDEDDKRYYIFINDFICEYYSNNFEFKTKTIKVTNHVEDIIVKPIEKFVTNKRKKNINKEVINKTTPNLENNNSNLESLKLLASKNNIDLNNLQNKLTTKESTTTNDKHVNSNLSNLETLKLLVSKNNIELNNLHSKLTAKESTTTNDEHVNSNLPNLESLKLLASKNNIDLNSLQNKLTAKEDISINTEDILKNLITQTKDLTSNNIINTLEKTHNNTTKNISNMKKNMSNMSNIFSLLSNVKINDNVKNNEDEYEYYEEKIIEYIEEKIIKKVTIEKNEKVYNSFDYNFKMKSYEDIYNDLQTITSNLYFIYKLKYRNNNNNNVDNSKIIIKKNNEKCSIFYTFNEYPHTKIVLKNNLLKLTDEWYHNIVCCLNNETFIKKIIRELKIEKINIIVLPYTNITYNEFNNVLLTTKFWNNFNCETILLHNENTIILEESINHYLNEDSLGYKLPMIFSYNKYKNGYSDISLRKKNTINNFLNNVNNINIKNKLCTEIKDFLNLEKYPEDILYSNYVHELNDINSEKKCITINEFNSKIFIVNYKFTFIETMLKKDIKEFLKKNKRIKFLEKNIL